MANMLYNGVELPDIESVWTDKVTYPYAFITYGNGYYWLYLLSYDHYIEGVMILATMTGSFKEYKCLDASDSWTYIGTTYMSAGAGLNLFDLSSVVWIGYDLLYENGTVCLAASAPVDPNAPTLPDLTSAETLQWISLGMAVRRGVKKETGIVFNQRVTTIENIWFHGAKGDFIFPSDFPIDDQTTYQMIINGEVFGSKRTTATTTLLYIGNHWLSDNKNSQMNEDDGTDFFFRWTKDPSIGGCVLFSRYPGTYHVKIVTEVST